MQYHQMYCILRIYSTFDDMITVMQSGSITMREKECQLQCFRLSTLLHAKQANCEEKHMY